METPSKPKKKLPQEPIKSPVPGRRVVWTVNACLLANCGVGIFYLGFKAFFVVALSVGSALVWEFLYRSLLKKSFSLGDGSAVCTGLLFASILPPGAPWYVPPLGTFFAIVCVKQLFGGLGYNIFNPALMGRAFIVFSFPRLLPGLTPSFPATGALTSSTPLVGAAQGRLAVSPEFWQKMFGNMNGTIGETAMVVLLLGAVVLLALRYISWQVPFSFLGSAALMACAFGGANHFFHGDALAPLVNGGMILGAFFLATDYVTSPRRALGKLIFGCGCGCVTMIIMLWGTSPEGMMSAILIMNCFTPLLDRWPERKAA